MNTGILTGILQMGTLFFLPNRPHRVPGVRGIFHPPDVHGCPASSERLLKSRRGLRGVRQLGLRAVDRASGKTLSPLRVGLESGCSVCRFDIQLQKLNKPLLTKGKTSVTTSIYQLDIPQSAFEHLLDIIVTIYSSIHARPLRVTGFQYSGWNAAEDSDTSGRELPFDFSVADDGEGQFLFVYRSVDGSLYGDTWHETLDDAFISAERQFGVSREEWSDA